MDRMDRTAKALLALVAMGLWGLLLRPLVTSAPPSLAQAPVVAPNRAAPASQDGVAVLEYQTDIVVVAKGKISWWTPRYSGTPVKRTLELRDSRPLP
jgi:hypothetical protein